MNVVYYHSPVHALHSSNSSVDLQTVQYTENCSRMVKAHIGGKNSFHENQIRLPPPSEMETRGLANTGAETSLTRVAFQFILCFMAVVNDFNRKVSDATAVVQKNAAGPQARLSFVSSTSHTSILLFKSPTL